MVLLQKKRLLNFKLKLMRFREILHKSRKIWKLKWQVQEQKLIVD